jgi:gas vesicle protein
MSAAELNALERDVEQARAKFANDLLRLRSPANLTRLKNDLWADVRETKDEVVDKAKDAAQDGAQRLVAELKARAAANPLATIAIGAGLAWRLVHRPPIATVLVGLGLIGLARTTPSQRASQPYMMRLIDEDPILQRRGGDLASHAEALADAAKEKVQDWSARAGDAIRQTAGEIAEKAASVAESASDALQGAQYAARETAAEVADRAGSAAARVSQTMRDAVPDREDRDTYLLAAAAVAVAAAVGIAYQRRGRGSG